MQQRGVTHESGTAEEQAADEAAAGLVGRATAVAVQRQLLQRNLGRRQRQVATQLFSLRSLRGLS